MQEWHHLHNGSERLLSVADEMWLEKYREVICMSHSEKKKKEPMALCKKEKSQEWDNEPRK